MPWADDIGRRLGGCGDRRERSAMMSALNSHLSPTIDRSNLQIEIR